MSSIAASVALDGVRLEYMPHIKPCPWEDKTHKPQTLVNNGPQIKTTPDGDIYQTPNTEYWVECVCCGARGPLADTKEEAIKKWNVV